ncbi:MAG: protein kinase [Bacteroidota bacterium]
MPIFKDNDIFAGRYQLINHLGSGGFAEVWKAKDMMADEVEIAIKIYAPERGLDEQGIRLFRKEYSNTAGLNHTHLLTAKHFDVHNGSPYLIMPYCPGGNLMDLIIDEKKHTEAEILDIFIPLAEALDYLHKKGIIHQDIKPHNILRDEDGKCVLADFGISGKVRRTIAARTQKAGQEQQSSFTPAYAPPERYTSKPSSEWDIFSLGVTIYELITGDLPFEDTGEALNRGSAIPPLADNWSRELSNALTASMSQDPAHRPSAAMLVNMLNQAISPQKGQPPKKSRGRRKTEVMIKPEITAQGNHQATPKKKKLKLVWILAGIFGIALATGLPVMINKMKKTAEENELYSTLNLEAATHLNKKEFKQAKQKYEQALAMKPDEYEPMQGSRNVAIRAANHFITRGRQFWSIDEFNLAILNCDSALYYMSDNIAAKVLRDSINTAKISQTLSLDNNKSPFTNLLIKPGEGTSKDKVVDIKIKDYEIIDQFVATNSLVKMRRIKKNGKYGFINAVGNVAVQPIYDDLYPFAGKPFVRARFKKGDKFGFLDVLGNEIVPAQYASAADFVGDKAKVSFTRLGFLVLDSSPDFGKEGMAFYIDINGNRIK